MSVAILLAHHLTVPTIAIGFALALVATLVAAEERDLRRAGSTGADRAQT